MREAPLDVVIRAKGFRRGSRRETILREIIFSAAPGEVLALLAPSGTGKTTALRIIVGLDRDFDGRVIRPPGRVGMMFQEPRLAPWLTVADNLRLVAPDGHDDAAVEAALVEAGLPGAGSRHPRELSLGMARRVALARALCVTPALMVLDEPFASLDAALAASLARSIAAEVKRRNITAVLTTHDLTQALAIADRVLVLSGRPATLAADLAIAPRGPAALRGELLARFPFLGSVGASGSY